MMKKYTYHGPTDTSVTLDLGGRHHDVMLHRGKVVELPDAHAYTATLEKLGHIKAVPNQAPAQAPAVVQSEGDA